MELKRISCVMMIGLLMFSLVPGLFLTGMADLVEPNNDFATAEVIAPATPMVGHVDSTTDTDDYYKFTVANGQRISTKLEGTTITEDIYGYLYQPDQTEITYTSSISTGQIDFINYTSSTATAGDWYYRISDGTGDYTLTVTLSQQNDAGSGTDAGDDINSAYPVTPNTYTGWIADDDENDYYSFAVVNAQIITVTFETGTEASDDLWAEFYDPNKDSITYTTSLNPGANETWEYTTSLLTAGSYYILVSGGGNSYSFKVTLTDQNDAGSGGDASDDATGADVIDPGTYAGWIADMDEDDYYQFVVADAQIITITFETGIDETDDLWAQFFDPDKNSITYTSSVNPGADETWTFTTSFDTAGNYYILVSGGDNSYSFTLVITDQDDAGQGVDAPDFNTDPPLEADLGVEHTGRIADDDAVDFYGFQVVDGQKIILSFTTGTETTDDLWAGVYDSQKDNVFYTSDINPDVTKTYEYTTSYDTAGLYYLGVEGGDNTYSFTFSVEDQNDANTGVDAIDTFPGTETLEVQDAPGWLADDDSIDHYAVNLTQGQKVNLTLTTGTTTTDDLYMTLYDTTKQEAKYTKDLNPDVSETISYTTSYETPGLYFFSVEGGENSYTFDVEVIPQDDAGYAMDAPKTLVDAFDLVEGTYNGWVADLDEVDAYNFTVNGGNVFTLNLTTGGTGTESVTVNFYDPQKTYIDSISAVSGVTATYTLPTDDAPLTNAPYFIEVKGDGLPYSLDLTLPTAPPDTTSPDVNILAPLTGRAFKASPVTVTGTASDDGTLTKVEVSTDNATWTLCTGMGAWSCVLNISAGANKITARATDSASNHGYDEITVHLDAQAPTVTPDTANGTKVKKKTFVLSGTATDNIGLALVQVSINGADWITANGTGTWSLEMTLKSGDNIIKVRVTDTAGNIVEETVTITYKKEKKDDSPGFEAVIFMGAIITALAVLSLRRRR